MGPARMIVGELDTQNPELENKICQWRTSEPYPKPAGPTVGHLSKLSVPVGLNGGSSTETQRRVRCIHSPFLFLFCASSIGAFRAFFEAISALS